jgi:uncharacterized protein DUF6929
VRAGSGMGWLGGRLAVVQDDASFVALVDPSTHAVHSIPLPADPGGVRQFDELRGNKRWKPDFEACTTVLDAMGDWLVILGSGSTGQRERIGLLRLTEGVRPESRSTRHQASISACAKRSSSRAAN